MNRELDLLIAKEIEGWNVYEPVGKDCNGENAGQVLVPYSGYCEKLFKQGWYFPPKGKIGEGFFAPSYTSDYSKALELAAKVKLPTPAHSLPSSSGELAKLCYEYFKSQQP